VSHVRAAPLRAVDVAALAQLACLIEVSAAKPGNVTPAAAFSDTRYEDFLVSAVAIGPVFAAAGAQPLGATIRGAIEATRRWTPVNTNLGIVLLLAPLARAALAPGARLRERLHAVLAESTVADAADVYQAIRLAAPAGLGRVPAQDVAETPTVPLLAAMTLASERDAIAREYATDFDTTFTIGAPAVARARAAGLSWGDATVETYLTLLAAAPDTHIARKRGAAGDVQRQAQAVLAAGGIRQPTGRDAVAALDHALRDPSNRLNPGATADLTTAAMFVTLLEGGFGAA
jgi:triphosphoribosyl-dephospho-CoA synthase